MIVMKKSLLAVLLLVLVGCGGGGGGNDTGSGVSGKVPYLVSGPSCTFQTSPTTTGKYDVTVTLEADGPIGVYSAIVWITDDNDWYNSTLLSLSNIPGTKRWTGSTDSYLPLDPGQYSVDEVVLEDGDIFTANPLGTAVYYLMPPISTSMYYVEETMMTDTGEYLYYGDGLTSKPVGKVTLP